MSRRFQAILFGASAANPLLIQWVERMKLNVESFVTNPTLEMLLTFNEWRRLQHDNSLHVITQ